LLAIGQWNVLGQAKVDEIVRARQRPDLTRGWRLLTVFCETRHDHARVESRRGLWILVVVATVVSAISSIVSVVSVVSSIVSVVSVVSSIVSVISSVVSIISTIIAVISTIVSTIIISTIVSDTTVVLVPTIAAIVGDAGVGSCRRWWVDSGRGEGSRSHDLRNGCNTVSTTGWWSICDACRRRCRGCWWWGGRGLTLTLAIVVLTIVLTMVLAIVLMVVSSVLVFVGTRRLRGSRGNVALASGRRTSSDLPTTQISLTVLVLDGVILGGARVDSHWATSECTLCTSGGNGDCLCGSLDYSVVDRDRTDVLDLLWLKMGFASLETVGKCRAREDEGDEGAGERKLHGGDELISDRLSSLSERMR
jgi:hypothetical protein